MGLSLQPWQLAVLAGIALVTVLVVTALLSVGSDTDPAADEPRADQPPLPVAGSDTHPPGGDTSTGHDPEA